MANGGRFDKLHICTSLWVSRRRWVVSGGQGQGRARWTGWWCVSTCITQHQPSNWPFKPMQTSLVRVLPSWSDCATFQFVSPFSCIMSFTNYSTSIIFTNLTTSLLKSIGKSELVGKCWGHLILSEGHWRPLLKWHCIVYHGICTCAPYF